MTIVTRWVVTSGVLAVGFLVSCQAAKGPPPAQAPRAKVTDPRADFRPTAWQAYSEDVDSPRRHVVDSLLCSATSYDCEATCLSRGRREAAECALDLAYADDDEARAIAQDVLASTGTVFGIEVWRKLDASYRGVIPIEPVLPVGRYRQHLAWLRDALVEIERVFAEVSRAAPSPVLFRTRPHGFRFFRTAERSFPSAYAIDGVVGYNVEGPLYDSLENVTSTLLHELFHLNDEGHDNWSKAALSATLDSIVEACGDDHDCLTPYAPSDDLAPDGTYYAFDARTRDVREYGAEVALRWFREQREIIDGGVSSKAAFKCGPEQNAVAWGAIVEEFFGGLDRTPPCG